MPVKFKMTLVKIGNSMRITIPKPIVDTLALKAGEELSLYMDDSRIIIEKAES